MRIRPVLRAGDVVKLSKKGKAYPRTFNKNSTLVVSEVNGNGVDRSSVITCRVEVHGEFRFHKFYRSELWSTGKNVFDKSVRVLNFSKQN
jgi:hypothetical protein